VKAFLVTLIVFRAVPMVASDSDPIVSVTGGQIKGAMLDQGGAVFKGIPYARPPVGDLRWREPIPVQRWSGVRDATAYGPMCSQVTSPLSPNGAEISKEDCLYLNVWTSEWPVRSHRPVMVWLHGGGNFAGTSTLRGTDGASLARRGVVVVSLNYRLGSFGFFAHPELTRESSHHASGNQGILDQIAGLRWVRANIARFGGDAKNVTMFGVSAGSIDVSVLMTSPLSRGLFHRAIGQSGPSLLMDRSGINTNDPLTLKEAEKQGEILAANWNLPSTASLKEIRAVPAALIHKAQPSYSLAPWPNLGIIVDGYVFPKQPVAVFTAGQQHRVPLLLGNASREPFPSSVPPKDFRKTIEEAYGPLFERALSLYAGPTDPIYGTPVDQWRTDISFRCTTVAQALWHAAAGNVTFEYEFAHTPVGREALGATHASEVSYVFGTLDRGIGGVGPTVRATAVDAPISEAMQQYWTNFAKNGDPNGGNLPKWPRFDVSIRPYLQFTSAGPVAKEGLRRQFCDLYIENVKRLRAER